MKRNFTFGLLAALVAMQFAYGCSSEIEITESEVPKDVMNAFKAKYPNAKNVEWEAEKEKGKFYFEADWKENGKEKEVHITSDGSAITEEE